jgi:hypothetical protein
MYSRMTAYPGRTEISGFFYVQGMSNERGVVMTASDTNMYQAGQLGTPLEYDMTHVGVHPCGAGGAYRSGWIDFLNQQPLFKWFFGHNMVFLEMPVNMMPERFPLETAAEANEAMGRTPDFPEVLNAFSVGMILPRIMDIRVGGRPRRIFSTESFRSEVHFPRMFQGNEFSWYAAMHGTLYCVL